MKSMKDFLHRSAIVVAHPDDEILWAGSAVASAQKIIVCYGELPQDSCITEGRRLAMSGFPHKDLVYLALPEAGSFNTAAWLEPAESPWGLSQRNLVKALRPSVAERYRRNFDTLSRILRTQLEGCRNVITHNPWGEYGHEDHIQVFRVVESLRAALGFDLWVSCYFGPKSVALQRRYLNSLGPSTAALPIDQALMQQIKALYIENQCWTWKDDYRWPQTEVFYRWMGHNGSLHPCGSTAYPLVLVNAGWRPPTLVEHAKNRIRTGLAILVGTRRQ
jgi:LmbE family N-acetylglucosaminyl deacetylase